MHAKRDGVPAPLPSTIGRPATSALHEAGLTTLVQAARRTRAELAELHGVGPKALGILDDAIAEDADAVKARSGVEAVVAHLEDVPSPQRETLRHLRATLRRILPYADEAMKYAMPAVVLNGKGIAGYASFRDHCGYFPMSSDVLAAAGETVAGYPTSKGGLRFPVDRPLPVGVVRQLVRLRIAELADVTDGVRMEHDAEGRLKAIGPMAGGELHGRWRWYRRDGSLMRTGSFNHGTQVGTWRTWNPDGSVASTTDP
jgi:uncharacterized protein YdhG (YjbR/CyaY superfamily)